jgi:DNA modification methylase
MSETNLLLPITETIPFQSSLLVLSRLLTQNLDFHSEDSGYASHNFHSFPAKFPPQLPRHFIDVLTRPGDVVLDPMQGSGTTILEALLTGRRAIGMDIDPLALLITSVKTTPLESIKVLETTKEIITHAKTSFENRTNTLLSALETRWDKKTREFVEYWFDIDSQLSLMSLLLEIEKIGNPNLQNFFKLALSAIIITKTGGVSLALDLAHTRPHRAKLIYSEKGEIIEGYEYIEKPIANIKYATKFLRSPFVEFEKRVQNNIKGLLKPTDNCSPAQVTFGNAEDLPLSNNSVDLIVTSPPYASNAIDYMRAHKFSLVWLGHPIEDLSEARGNYIGGELLENFPFESLPDFTSNLITEIAQLDDKKGQVLRRYYSEMTRVIKEMYRVLKPGKSSIVVVGNSMMRGRDTETQNCLANIGRSIGFEVPAIGIRNLDRNRRMLPAGAKINKESQIQQRMHEEYVIGFYKPG